MLFIWAQVSPSFTLIFSASSCSVPLPHLVRACYEVFPILFPRPLVCRGAPALTPEPRVAFPSHSALPSRVHHGASACGLKQALFPVVAVLMLRCAPVLCCVHCVLKAEQSLVYALLGRERRGSSSSHERQTPLKPMSHPQAHGFVGEAWALKEFRWNFFTPSARLME